MFNQTERAQAQRRRRVSLIRDWLASDPRMSVEEMESRLLRKRMDIGRHSILHYRRLAKILLNRELVFGSDAERMFPIPSKRQ